MTIRVVVGEDNFLVREGISRALERMDGIQLMAANEDLESLRASVDTLEPDVVLTDIRMPPTRTDEGIRLAADLRRSHPRVGVVILSQHIELAYATTLFADGSDGRAYLLKERLKDQHELHQALQAVAEGRSLVDSRIVERLLTRTTPHTDPQLDRLTPRERQTLAMIAEGRSNNAIAEQLQITKRAVERQINAIFVKLELTESGDVNRRVRAALLYLAGEPE
jgi:DNA-binding NarL/FixJ family response regulator